MWLDDIVGYFNPKSKVSRLRARAAIKAWEEVNTRGYDAASRRGTAKKLVTSNKSADSENSNAIDIIRARARESIRNNPYSARAVNAITTNVVGKGIVPVITGPNEEVVNRLVQLWKEWVETPNLDYDGYHNIYSMQAAVMQAVVSSGEVLIRRRVTRGGVLPFKIQLLESDHLVTTRTFTAPNAAKDNDVVQGVELDGLDGKPVAYHLYEAHPGESNRIKNIENRLKILRLGAEDILHVFLQRRPGEHRGVSWLASVLTVLEELAAYERALLVRQKVSACYTAFVHDIEPPIDNSPKGEFDSEHIEPGMIDYLPPGKDIKFGNPPSPGTDYPAYKSTQLHAIAAGIGMSYEALTGDLSQVNFSSARMGWLEFQRNIDYWRGCLMNQMFNWRVSQWFLEAAELAGANVAGVSFEWVSPRREMIDPTKEIPAAIKAVRAGFSSLSGVIREQGKDPKAHFAQLQKDNEILDQLKLVLDTDPRQITASGQAQSVDPSETTQDSEE